MGGIDFGMMQTPFFDVSLGEPSPLDIVLDVSRDSEPNGIDNHSPPLTRYCSMTWTPYREPLRTTLLRTGTIALVVGAILARPWRGDGPARWPIATLLVLWPALGGHFVEIWFLNWLRPRLPDARGVQVFARFAVWFVGGLGLAMGMGLTAMAMGIRPARGSAWWSAWWIGGLAFIGIELVAHLFLQLRGRPSFYNGRG
jgi:hypothetical protein